MHGMVMKILRKAEQADRPRITPLVAIWAPSALSTELSWDMRRFATSVPRIFENTSDQSSWLASGQICRSLMSDPVSRVIEGVAMSGQPRVQAYGAGNVSYNVELHGPMLSCRGNQTVTLWLDQLLRTYRNNVTEVPPAYDYLSWVSDDPLDHSQLKGRGVEDSGSNFSKLYVARLPLGSSYVTQCSWYNASFVVGFDFQYPVQIFDVRNITFTDELLCPAEQVTQGSVARNMIHCAFVQSFNSLFQGYAASNSNGTEETDTIYKWTSIDWTNNVTASQGLEQLLWNISLSLLTVPEIAFVLPPQHNA